MMLLEDGRRCGVSPWQEFTSEEEFLEDKNSTSWMRVPTGYTVLLEVYSNIGLLLIFSVILINLPVCNLLTE